MKEVGLDLLHELALKVICHLLPQCWCNQSAWERLALWEAGWAAPWSVALGSCLLQGYAAFWVVFAAVQWQWKLRSGCEPRLGAVASIRAPRCIHVLLLAHPMAKDSR